MQYSLLIDQARSVEWGLNLSEATLFCVVFNAPHWAAETIKGNQVWYWIANAKLAVELPLLTSKPDTIKRLMASLQKKGLINRSTDGRRTYIQITAKGKQWNSKEGREINPDLPGKNIPTKAGNISPRLDNHLSGNQDHKEPVCVFSESFETFWKLYPKKVDKKKTLGLWLKLKPDQALISTIMQSLGKYCISEGWTKDGGRFVPHASTWLNAERWNDEVAASTAKTASFMDKHTGFAGRSYGKTLTENKDGTYAF